MPLCVAQEKMSPLMPKLKCPHERGKDLNEPEAVTEVSSCWVGRKWKNYFRGGRSENRGLPPDLWADPMPKLAWKSDNS